MMNRVWTGLLCFIFALHSVGLSVYCMAEEPVQEKTKKKLLYYDFSQGFVHPPTKDKRNTLGVCAQFLKTVADKYGYELVCTKDGKIFDSDLTQYAAIIFYTSGDLDKPNAKHPGAPMSEQGVKNFFAAIQGGVGFLGFHSATDTWRGRGAAYENQPIEKLPPYIKLIGGEFIRHGAQQNATLTPTEPIQLDVLKNAQKPIVHHDEWYCNKNFDPNMHVILIQETKQMLKDSKNSCYNRPAYPCVWCKMEGKGRVAYSSLGHGEQHWKTPLVQGIVTDLVRFVAGDLELDTTPNFNKVCPDAVINLYPQEKK